MAQRACWIVVTIVAGALSAGGADAGSRSRPTLNPPPAPIAGASATLAPFQHVRFCLRYPSDCQTNPSESDRIFLNANSLELLKQVNHSVNLSIIPTVKGYGSNLADAWTIAPRRGDCSDYAVTKRHQLLAKGLPAKALRLSVVTTAYGIGHLVLVVATTKGDIVMDNLTEAIRPWQSTDYHWLKIQSGDDAQLWHEIKSPGRDLTASRTDLELQADR